jgi:hypothetical protein
MANDGAKFHAYAVCPSDGLHELEQGKTLIPVLPQIALNAFG